MGDDSAPLNGEFDGDPERYQTIRHCWLNRRREAFLHGRMLNLAAGARVLEIGSGTGWLLSRLAASFPHLEFVGIEPQESYVAFSRRQSSCLNLRFVAGTAENASQLLESGFHVILSNDMLHHVESEAEVARSLHHLAAPGGRWWAIEPNCRNPYTFLRQSLKHGERNFWPGNFIELAAEAGWTLKSRSFLFLIPTFIQEPPPLLIKLEQSMEEIPFLAGGVHLLLERKP